MSIWYVSKSGNDSNSGASYALSKLTIGGALTVAASNDTIVVGAGLYNEKPSVSGKNLTISADGIVVVDGTGLAAGNLFYMANANCTINSYSTGGQWIFQNCAGSSLIYISENSAVTFIFSNCSFLGNASNAACVTQVNTYGGQTMSFTNCIFSGCTAGYGIVAASYSGVTLNNCTIYNCSTGVLNTYIFNSYYSIFSNCTTAWNAGSGAGNPVTMYNQYYNITNWKLGSTTYTTLAQVQAATWDFGSVSANPYFTDPANNIFYLTQVSPISQLQGAIPYGYTQGAANDSLSKWNIIAGGGYDNSGWYNPDGNVSKDGTTGYLYLSSGPNTTGVIWSPVYDMGYVTNITEVDLSTIQTWPTNMIDKTTTDIRPNYQTIEIRASNSSFAQNDGTVGWTETKYNVPISVISGRYVQLRITMTNMDVGA